ncbi:hypothetical protein GCM10010518_58680 [Kitasatospora cinereorecta]
MPVFPSDLRALADEALARIASDEDGPASNWVDPEDAPSSAKPSPAHTLGNDSRDSWQPSPIRPSPKQPKISASTSRPW